MIPRYSRPEMTAIWSSENRYRIWWQIEVFAAEAMGRIGMIPAEDAATIRKAYDRNALGDIDVAAIDAIEAVTKHDVIAFLTWAGEKLGPEKRWLHQGMTSSDVLDTALSVQLSQAADILLADLGQLLLDRHGGRASALIEAANGSAVELVRQLQAMPMFRDAAYHGGEIVPFLKRAQLTAADLHVAFGGAGLGRFGDLDRLTMFADNLVPHVLRVDGVLAYDGHLTEMLDNGVPLAPDSVEEVEVRATAVHAVELLAAALDRPAHEVDHLLWTRGQGFAYRDGLSRRHRTRTWAY